jgi:hypothetical protein
MLLQWAIRVELDPSNPEYPMASETAKLQGHPREPTCEDRLNSWKETAAYVKCSERTVRRWEEEGLPVHRHPHKAKAAIYAYKSELLILVAIVAEDVRLG